MSAFYSQKFIIIQDINVNFLKDLGEIEPIWLLKGRGERTKVQILI